MSDRFRIMIVDEDEESLAFFRRVLSGEFEIVTASDGFDALEQLGRWEPDLLMAEVNMPLMNGFELCESVHRRPSFEDTEVILISAKSDPDTIKHAYDAGADLFIKKPIDADRLMKNLLLSVSGKPGARPKKMSVESPTAPLFRESPTPPRATPLPSAPTPPRTPAIAPLKPEPTPAPRPQARPAPAPAPAKPAGTPRLMLVDDDPEIVSFLEMAFEDEFEIVWASDGLQAIERIVDYEPDIMFVDIMMPRMNGFQLCQSLRRNASYKTTPILFLTAKSSRRDREYADRCGADAYITKPFDVGKLRDLVHVLMDKPEFQIRPKKFGLKAIRAKEVGEQEKREEKRQLREKRRRYESLKDFIDRNL